MIKRIKPAILLLILVLSIQGVYGQKPANISDYLNDKFTRYVKSVPREEIYIHSDRDEYISGENLWFNVYLIDRLSSKPSMNSKVAYFELLNQENRPIVQKKILLVDGFGPGEIDLPDTLSTGVYTIRAYTNWMKNFLPYNCFIKEIRIYNSFSSRTIKSMLNTGGSIGENSVGYEGATDAGLSFTVNNLEPDFLSITVTANTKYRAENSNLFYLFIQTHGVVNRVSNEKISDETTKIVVPKNQLSPGINQITIFNAEGKPIGDRFIYTPPVAKSVASLKCLDSIPRRNSVTLDLDFGKDLITGAFSEFSVSITPESIYHSLPDMNDYMVFGSEFGFMPLNEIKGRKLGYMSPEAIDRLLANVKSNWINWNNILSDDVPSYKYGAENENCFLSGRLLSGDKKKGDSARFVILSTPGKLPVFQYARTDDNGNFRLNLNIDGKVKDLVIQPDQTTNNQSINIESPFIDQYLYTGKSADTAIKQMPAYIPLWSVNHQVMAIYGNSSATDPVTFDLPVPKPKRFYGKPDNTIIMKDYIKLPVMQEVFFELLQGVSLDSKKSGWTLTINDPVSKHPYDEQPGMFIDGVKITDPSMIATLDPENVEEIDVVRERYYVGDYQFPGLVNVITKAGDFSHVTLPSFAIRLPYRVIDPVAFFKFPIYNTPERKKNHIPDFRNTLYWNPAVVSDQNGKARIEFSSSDFVGDFVVNIQGISPDGNAFSLKKIIKVK
jgi:hypothetical protein